MARLQSLLAPALLVSAFLIYLPGTGGPYLADDFPNLVDNPHLLLASLRPEALGSAAFSSASGPTYRPLSMLSFALNYTLAGDMDPDSAKLLNVLLHLLAGALVYALTSALLPGLRSLGPEEMPGNEARAVALFTTALWLLHPLFVSTVLYTVQRMSILSAIFVLAGCLYYLRHRAQVTGFRDGLALAAAISLFTVMAFLCKENGALLPGFLLLIEFVRFGFRFPSGASRATRAALVAVLALPAAFIIIYLGSVSLPHWGDEATGYYLTIHDRFLTQFRALAQYAGWLTLLSGEPMGLYHDDFVPSTGLLDPPATLLTLLFWFGAACGAVALAARRNVIGLGVLWYLWGHVLESSVLPLAPVFEHRNYLPGYGLLLAFAAGLHGALQRVRIGPPARLATMVLVLVVLPAYQLRERVLIWSNERDFNLHSLATHPHSAHTLLSAAVFLDRHGDPGAAVKALHEAQRAEPREVSLVFAEAALHCGRLPAQSFGADLERKLADAAAAEFRTAAARYQFVRFARICAESAVNDGTLVPLYERLSGSGYDNVAAMSLFGIGAAHLHRRELAAARAAWQEAMERSPQGEALRPWVEELERWEAKAVGAKQ